MESIHGALLGVSIGTGKISGTGRNEDEPKLNSAMA